jgi:Tfp pilus assembly protein PilN
MNAVNLLPPKHRPRQATGGKSGSSFVLLGVLGAVVVAMLVYVLSANSINDSKTKIAEAQAETVRANAQADALGAYGNFAKVKQQRVSSVKDLAQKRVDWERTVRELARVLPSGVWVTNASASDSGTPGDATSGSTTAAPTNSGGAALDLTGCAVSQKAVARTIVRLRQMQGTTDVQLDHSSRPATSSSSSSGDSGSTSGCGETHGSTNYEFKATVVLEKGKAAPYQPGKVPASLGGGQ